MGLEEYRKKRKPGKTPEPGLTRKPAAGAGGKGLEFVVQKHFASRLHYDLRLENDGVLKSWAVPKGPSLDPHDKRLAVRVEDHPFEYRKFEGRIPKGEYGAGVVEIWDSGTYSPAGGGLDRQEAEKAVAAALRKGHLDFYLAGRKLKGRFTLVRLRNDEKNWLLIKGKEERPDPPPPAGKPDFGGAEKSPLPHDLEPMLATLVDEPFDREGWSFEVKWDGYRSLAAIDKGKVRLISRNGRSQNEQFPSVAAALKSVSTSTVLDGEIVALDEKGRPDFQHLQNALRSGQGELRYYVFDVLYAGGYDLRGLPLRRRREILKSVLPSSTAVRLSEAIEKDGRAFFKAAEKNGLEGIVGKNLDSAYLSGHRSSDWLKIKTQKRQEAVIGGFTQPRSSRKYFGALILGANKDGGLAYIGDVGTGFDETSLKSIAARLKPLITSRCPFAGEVPTGKGVTWVAPKLVGEIRFSGWTSEGRMRHPVFLGLREDKSPKDVRIEEAVPAETMPETTSKSPGLKTKAKLTNLEKVFWPKEGLTKKDVIEYYDRMAECILPYLKDRPQALNRHPNGIEEKGFFQKNITDPTPEWVKTLKIASEQKGKELNVLVCQNKDTLIYEANLGCIELNVWSSIVQRLDNPDYAILDFDPLEAPFLNVIEAVLSAKSLLDDLGLPAFCKTSGGKGMHVFIPLEPRFSYEQSRELAHLVYLVVRSRNRELLSLERNPENRKGKVYLDYLQNRRGATIAAPYALRPREGAPVSTPLDWKEVTAKLHPLDFNIRTVPERMAKKGDPWKDLFKKRVDINAALAKFEKWRKKRTSS